MQNYVKNRICKNTHKYIKRRAKLHETEVKRSKKRKNKETNANTEKFKRKMQKLENFSKNETYVKVEQKWKLT